VSSLVGAVGLLGAASAISGLGGFLVSLVAARTLSTLEFGAFSILTTTYSWLVLGLDGGLNTLVATRAARRPGTRLYAAVFTIRVYAAGAATIAVAAVYAGALVAGVDVSGGLGNWLLVVASALWLVLLSTEQARAQGRRAFGLVGGIAVLISAMRLAATAVVSRMSPSLGGLVMAYTMPGFALGIGTAIATGSIGRRRAVALIGKIAPTILMAAVTVALSAAVFRVGIWSAAIHGGLEAAASFGVALQMASLVLVVGSAVTAVLLPEVAAAQRGGDAYGFFRKHLARSVPLVGVAMVLAAGGALLVPVIFGPGYEGVQSTAFVLSVSFILSAFNGPFYLYQQCRMRYSLLAGIHGAQVAAILGGSLVLAEALGVIGVAIADLLSRIGVIGVLVALSMREAWTAERDSADEVMRSCSR
jgi:O-antigen/teichoic acid export membrane protein